MQFSFSRSLRSLVKLFKWRYIINIFFSTSKGIKKRTTSSFSRSLPTREMGKMASYVEIIFTHSKDLVHLLCRTCHEGI